MNEMIKFTKGPWKISPLIPNQGGRLISALEGTNNFFYVCDVHSVQDWKKSRTDIIEDKEKTMANADLIAASPDLYEALYLLVSRATASEEKMSCFIKAKKALAKARGES